MAAGSSYFDGALRMRLAAHFAKVIRVVIEVRQQRLGVNLQRQGRLLSVEQFDYALERSNRIDVETRHNRCFVCVLFGHDQSLHAVGSRGHAHRQCALNRTNTAVQRQLTDDERVAQFLAVEIAVRAEYSDCNRQIETRPFFLHICWSQIDCHPMNRKKEAAVVDGSAYSLAALANGRVRQANHREYRHHAVAGSGGQVDRDMHDIRVDAEHGCANGFEEHSDFLHRSVFRCTWAGNPGSLKFIPPILVVKKQVFNTSLTWLGAIRKKIHCTITHWRDCENPYQLHLPSPGYRSGLLSLPLNAEGLQILIFR